MTPTLAAAYGALLIAIAHAGASLTAIWRARDTQADPPRSAAAAQRVLMIRPCAGTEPELAATLGSTPSTVCALRIVLSTVSDGDPATPTVLQAAAALRAQRWNAEARLSPTPAINRKVGQLAVAVRDAPPEETIIVIADSDVDLTSVDLDALIDPLVAFSSTAATWMPVVEGPGTTSGDRASAALLTSSLHAFGLLGHLDRRSLVGKLFAVRRDVLRDVGGFESFGDVLGEDAELARRIWEGGHRTGLVRGLASSRASGRSGNAVVGRFARWLSVVRSGRPALLLAYPLMFAPMLGLGFLGAIGALDAPWVVTAAMLLYASTRWLVARRGLALARQHRTSGALLRDIWMTEVLLLRALGRALRSRTVTWRQRRLQLGRRGRLIGAAEHPSAEAIECSQPQ